VLASLSFIIGIRVTSFSYPAGGWRGGTDYSSTKGPGDPGAKLASVPGPSPLASPKPAVARFGVFEADLLARELRKQGRRMRLQDQPFALLALLLERAGNVVTREELRERLWPADTFVDFDHSLNTAVNKIREVLGDSASSPRFVETVARRGYRFLGQVQWEAQAEGEAAAAGASEEAVDHPELDAELHPELEIPALHRGIPRALFALIQVMYLIFYVVALIHWPAVEKISWLDTRAPLISIAVLVTAGVGIPVRLYFLSAAAFDYGRLGEKFRKIFLGVLVLDELWAVAPFLLAPQIGFGAAFAATAALLYVPFAERTLVRMAYPRTIRHIDRNS
jgi:cholera toxin transcriptional activator